MIQTHPRSNSNKAQMMAGNNGDSRGVRGLCKGATAFKIVKLSSRGAMVIRMGELSNRAVVIWMVELSKDAMSISSAKEQWQSGCVSSATSSQEILAQG